MNKKQFLEILDLAWGDIRALEPNALGLIQIVVHKNGDDHLDVKIGANVPPNVVEFAIEALGQTWKRKGSTGMVIFQLKRKKAI